MAWRIDIGVEMVVASSVHIYIYVHIYTYASLCADSACKHPK